MNKDVQVLDNEDNKEYQGVGDVLEEEEEGEEVKVQKKHEATHNSRTSNIFSACISINQNKFSL